MAVKYAVVFVVIAAISVHWIIDYWTNSVDINVYYDNKRVVLTGASKGIGRELALQLAIAGAELFLVARSKELLASIVTECQSVSNSKIHSLVADVGNVNDCRNIADEAINKMDGIDILLINAAYSPTPVFFNQINDPDQTFTNVFRVNFLQSVNLVHFLLPSLTEAKGHIVAVSSGASMVGMPQVAAYSSSKHALNGFFKALRQEFTIQRIPVDVTIMPLPYVLTKKAVDNWRPIGTGGGITTEVCAETMIKAIPSRKSWIYIDWSSYIISIISSPFPDLTEYFVRMYIAKTSYLFSE